MSNYFLFTYVRIERGLPGEEAVRWFKVNAQNPEIKIKDFLSTFGHYEYDPYDDNTFRFETFNIKITGKHEFARPNEVALWIARRYYINGNLLAQTSFYGKDEGGNEVRCISGVAHLHRPGDMKPIYLGKLDDDGNFIRGDRSPLTDKHRIKKQFKGWAINSTVLERMPGKYVIIRTDAGVYKAERDRVIKEKLVVETHIPNGEKQYGIRERICEKTS